MLTLPSDAKDKYISDGYYLAQDLSSLDYINDVLMDINIIIKRHLLYYNLPINKSDEIAGLHENLSTMYRFDQSLYLATLHVLSKIKSLYEIFLSKEVASVCLEFGIALPIMHTHPLFHIMSNRLRFAQGYHGFEAHQDWTGLQTSLNAIVVWLPFHDVDKVRFPLEVLPQSHLQGLCPGAIDNNEYTIDDSYLCDKEFMPIEVNAGDVVFMSPFTVHRTGVTNSDDLRIAASWRFEDALEETFISRKYPFAQSRLIQHDLFFPDFPNAEQIKKAIHFT